MADKTDLQLLLTKGALSSLWENKAMKTPPATGNTKITNGQIYIGLDDTNRRAMLFIDNNNKRHVLTADIAWDDIRNVPTDIVYQSAFDEHVQTAENLYLQKTGDIMTGALHLKNTKMSFAVASGTDTIDKAHIEYNDITQSLDFTFT